ncbi:helix-turn-helix domain-containing protein [Stenotrophomonas maltophilia]|uniref:helix-turn-helix domain-containing protein n=1 Tax=Stenotrophomonas maltophilia TaxID=40324 RepID=UPI0021AFEB88|nr:helix-turn-helix domain-containing protein [Stenotrophomonas maltophilia]
MSTSNELLDKVRAACNITSDMALAERLMVTRSLVSRWRAGDKPIPDERIAQLCAMGKLDGPLWIAMIHAERAQSATERALWRLMLDRMSAAAAVVALVALSMPGLTNAKTAQNQAVSAGLLTHSVYYVQSIPGDAGVPFASIPSRPGSYGFLHRPIRVLCMPQAIQPQTKPPPRDNDLFLFKGGSIQSLIGHESQRSQ